MKRTIVLLGTMFLAVAIGQEKTAPIDPGGWNKAKWGMNQSQISDVFPEAKPYEVPGIERGSKRLLPKGDVVGHVQFIRKTEVRREIGAKDLRQQGNGIKRDG